MGSVMAYCWKEDGVDPTNLNLMGREFASVDSLSISLSLVIRGMPTDKRLVLINLDTTWICEV